MVARPRIRQIGQARREFFDKKYTFALSFDLEVMVQAASPTGASNAPAGGLVADSHDGLPIPEGYNGIQRKGANSAQRPKQLSLPKSIQSLNSIAGNWPPPDGKRTSGTPRSTTSGKLSFTRETGSLVVQLKANGKRLRLHWHRAMPQRPKLQACCHRQVKGG